MFEIIPPAIAFGLVAASFTTLGIAAVALIGARAEAHSGTLAAFAAGTLICITLLHLIPEALMMTPRAPLFMFIGFAGAYFLNRGVLALAGGRDGSGWAVGLTPVLAIATHSFVDGLAYAVTFSVDFVTGALTALGLILHEAPEGIIVFGLLKASGLRTFSAFVLAFLAAAITTPLGAALATVFVGGLSADALGAIFAATAGLLLYVSAGHLLPHVEREPAVKTLPALILGGVIAVGAVSLHVHGDHDHGEDHGHSAHDGAAHDDHAGHADHSHEHHGHGDHDHGGHDHD